MTKINSSCIDCRCEEVSHTLVRHGRHVTTEETIYSCGARQKELSDTERRIATIEFEGCCCEPGR